MRALVTGIVFSERYESACANCRNVAHDFRLLKAVIEVNNKQQLLLIEKAKESSKYEQEADCSAGSSI